MVLLRVLFPQVIRVLRDRDEDSEVVHRLDQHAKSRRRSLGSRLKWMLSFLFFCLRVPCSRMVVLGDDCEAFFAPVAVRMVGFQLVVLAGLCLILDRRKIQPENVLA